jgi:hypothetical protein
MYYIYHIKGVKIGVSTQPEIRVNRQGYTDFEILETHTDIYEVSNREIQLQNEYGYEIDKVPYYKSYKWARKASSNGGVAVHKKYPNLGKELGAKNGRENGIKSRYKLRKPVYQYDMTGNLIKIFEGANSASKELGYDISANLRGRTKHAHGFIFSYKELHINH